MIAPETERTTETAYVSFTSHGKSNEHKGSTYPLTHVVPLLQFRLREEERRDYDNKLENN